MRRPSSSGSDFLHFLLICAGVGLALCATLHLPQQEARRHYEARRNNLQEQAHWLRAETARYRRCEAALAEDPHYRGIALSHSVRHRADGVLTVEEYVRLLERTRSGSPDTARPARRREALP